MFVRVPLLFALYVPLLIANECDPADVECQLKADPRDVQLIRVRSRSNAHLPCNALTDATTKLEWWVARRREIVAQWPEDVGPKSVNQTTENPYAVDANGTLIIRDAHRRLVEEYECAVYIHSIYERSSFILFRLDYSFFYQGPLFFTVFWGSCLVSLLACVASFILNLLWILVRKVTLWWINRSERISRVRNMVEAMEKYRQKQMEHLHDNYQKKVTAIRDNYHQQVDELRNSYAKQADRFRDYRQTRMETMTQHLDNIRDNYNQQLNRIREYGSRRAERLFESYERQLNRMRTFTLQHRLKLMRQYKVKQPYINRLLDNIATTNNEQTIEENEKAIREMLDLTDHNLPLGTDGRELTRSASYYSLPEFPNDEYETHIQRASQRRRFPAVNFAELRAANAEIEPLQVPFDDPRPHSSKTIRMVEKVDETNSTTPLLEPRRPTSMVEKTTNEEKPKDN